MNEKSETLFDQRKVRRLSQRKCRKVREMIQLEERVNLHLPPFPML